MASNVVGDTRRGAFSVSHCLAAPDPNLMGSRRQTSFPRCLTGLGLGRTLWRFDSQMGSRRQTGRADRSGSKRDPDSCLPNDLREFHKIRVRASYGLVLAIAKVTLIW